MVKPFWICENCKSKVDFYEQLLLLFDEEGDSMFDSEKGIYFHTIICDECNSSWVIEISGRKEPYEGLIKVNLENN